VTVPGGASGPGLKITSSGTNLSQTEVSAEEGIAAGMSPLEACRWLESTPGSIALHESIWVYPIVESVHVLTLSVFLGLTVMVDLRLLGASLSATPVSQVMRRLLPSQRRGVSLHHIAHHVSVGLGYEAAHPRAPGRRRIAGTVGGHRRLRTHDRL